MATITFDPSSGGSFVSGQLVTITVSVDTLDSTANIKVKATNFWYFDDPGYVDAHYDDGEPKVFDKSSPNYSTDATSSKWALKLVVEGSKGAQARLDVTEFLADAQQSENSASYNITDVPYIDPGHGFDTAVLKLSDVGPTDADTNHVDVSFVAKSGTNGLAIGVPMAARISFSDAADIGKLRIYYTASDTGPQTVTRPEGHVAPYVAVYSDDQGAFSFLLYPTDQAVGGNLQAEVGASAALGTVLVPDMGAWDPNIRAPVVIGISGGIYSFDAKESPVPITAQQGHAGGQLAIGDTLYLFSNPHYPPTADGWVYTQQSWLVDPDKLNGAALMYLPAAYLSIRDPDNPSVANTLAFAAKRISDGELRTSAITRLIADNTQLGNHPRPPKDPALPAPKIREYRGGGVINADDVKDGLHVEISLAAADLALGGVTTAKATDVIVLTIYLNGYKAGTDDTKEGHPDYRYALVAADVTAGKVVITVPKGDIAGYGASLHYGDVGTLEAQYTYQSVPGDKKVPSRVFGPVNFASRTMGTGFKKTQ